MTIIEMILEKGPLLTKRENGDQRRKLWAVWGQQMPPNGVMTFRGKQGRKPRILAGLSIFPRVLPHQAVPTPWDPALRAFLLPGVLGLTQNSMDYEDQTIPSAPKRIKWASNSQKFNQNTTYSRSHSCLTFDLGWVVLSPCGSGQTKMVLRERKMKQLYSEK